MFIFTDLIIIEIVDEILALLTPELLTLIAYFVGAVVIGFTLLAGSMYVASYFGEVF